MWKIPRLMAPYFREPSPLNPLTGERDRLGFPPALPYMAVMRVVSEYDDWLVCEGWIPDDHAYHEDVVVAKPYTLRRNPVCKIRFPDYTDTYSYVDGVVGTRTVTRDPGGGYPYAFVQKIEPSYFVGSLLVAVRMEGFRGVAVREQRPFAGKWSQPDEIKLPDEMPHFDMTGGVSTGDIIWWMDINVAGRQWHVPSMTASGYAMVYDTGWANTPKGSAFTQTVNVKTCDYGGGQVQGAAFPVKTMPNVGVDTALFNEVSVVKWELESGGEKVITSYIWDDPIGTVKQWYKPANQIRQGWRVCDGDANVDFTGMYGRFAKHIGPSGTEKIGDKGGFKTHGVTENNHDDHVINTEYAIDTVGGLDIGEAGPGETGTNTPPPDAHTHPITVGLGEYQVAEAFPPGEGNDDTYRHSNTDNRPPYTVVRFIERFE